MRENLGPRASLWSALIAAAFFATCAPAALAQSSEPAADAAANAGAGAEAEDAAEDTGADVDVDEAALLSEDELDELVAPIALYPDALLAQVFVASTYPLDVVKASRWVAANEDMPEGERADAAEAEGWDPSVSVLAAGFPTVIDAMASDLDQTELLGDAMLTQSDDVLDVDPAPAGAGRRDGQPAVQPGADRDRRGRQHQHRARPARGRLRPDL